MRSIRIFRRVVILTIGLFISCVACAQSLLPDSVFTMVKDSAKSIIKDSSTYYNHFYHLTFFGNDIYSYQNLGSEPIYDLLKPSGSQPGFGIFSSLCRFPVRVNELNHSHIGYVKGSKLEQAFNAGFSQRIFKHFTLQGDFRSITSPGFFINQQNKILNYHAAIAYKSRKENYSIKIEVHPAVINQQMNGGIVHDSLLENIANNAGKSLEVNLTDAAIKYRNNDMYLRQRFLSSSLDSLKSFKWFIDHNLHYRVSSYIYNSTSANADFYESVFFDSTTTSDSLHYYMISNALLPGFRLETKAIKLEGSLSFGFDEAKYHVFDSTVTDNIYKVGINMFFESEDYGIKLSAAHKKSDVYDDGISLNCLGNIRINRGRVNLNVELNYLDDFPSFFSSLYVSNHFIWSNKFVNQKTGKLVAAIFSDNGVWGFSGNIYMIKDYIYYNSHAVPVQYDGEVNVTEVKAKFNFPVIGKWYIYSDTRFQKSNNEDIYRVPDIYTYSAIYNERFAFKNAMKISFGAGFNYFTSYKANALMPATSQYYLQDEVKIGNYPYFDFFVNFRIKTIDFFIKIEHLNEGLSGATNFYMPHQPSPGRTLKVGFNWVFNDNQEAIR